MRPLWYHCERIKNPQIFEKASRREPAPSAGIFNFLRAWEPRLRHKKIDFFGCFLAKKIYFPTAKKHKKCVLFVSL